MITNDEAIRASININYTKQKTPATITITGVYISEITYITSSLLLR